MLVLGGSLQNPASEPCCTNAMVSGNSVMLHGFSKKVADGVSVMFWFASHPAVKLSGCQINSIRSDIIQ